MPLARVAPLALLALLALPLGVASAAPSPAGFTPGAVWLSKATLVAGDTVKAYAALHNSAEATLSGSVIFMIDDATIGSVPFSLTSGAAVILSTPWEAVAGTHTLYAKIESATDPDTSEAIALSYATSSAVAIVVAEAPAPSAFAEAVEQVVSAAGSALPAAGRVAGAAIEILEPIRKGGVAILEKALEERKSPKATEVAGTLSALPTALLSTLLPIFESPLLFSVLFVLSSLVILIIVFRALARGRL